MEEISIDFVQSGCLNTALLDELTDEDLSQILPLLTRLAYLTPGKNGLISFLSSANFSLDVQRFLPYFRFNFKDLRTRFSEEAAEIQKLPCSEIQQKLSNDSFVTAVSNFEQSMSVEDQIGFVFTQMLMLKRLVCVEKSQLPKDYTFHLLHYEALQEVTLVCLICIFENNSSNETLQLVHLVAVLIATAAPWNFTKKLVLNMPNHYQKVLTSALQCPMHTSFEQDRNKFILNLITLRESSADYLIDRLIKTQMNANLLFDLLCVKSTFVPNSECLELFLLEILVAEPSSATKTWLKPFLKQCWKSKSNCAAVIRSSVSKLVEQFNSPETDPTNSLFRASSLVKIITCLRLLTQWRLEDDGGRRVVSLMTLRGRHSSEAFFEFCRIVFASLVLIPQYILNPDCERDMLDWIKYLLNSRTVTLSEGGEEFVLNRAPHIETLVNIAVYFLHDKDTELQYLVSSIYGVDVNLKTENFNRLRVFFTQMIFTETEIALICSKMQITKNLCANSFVGYPSYLPIDCFCNLQSKNTFERSRVSISRWVSAQILNCTFPLHSQIVPLINNFITTIVNPITPSEFKEEPFRESEISKLFMRPFIGISDEKIYASQVLLLYYLLQFKEILLTGAKGAANIVALPVPTQTQKTVLDDRYVSLQYSDKLMETIPIRFIVRHGEKFQTQMQDVYPRLLKLAYNQFPQLFQFNSAVSLKWFFGNTDAESAISSSEDSGVLVPVMDDEAASLPTPAKLLFHFEDPFRYTSECIKSLMAMSVMNENDALNMMDAFVSILPSLLKNNIALRISNLALHVWNRINACLPRILWVKTANVLLSRSNIPAKYTMNDLTIDPLLVLNCNEQVFRCPTLLTVTIRILSAFLIASRVYMAHQISLYSGNSSSTVKDQDKDDLRAALISTQESTAVQLLLETCLARDELEKVSESSNSNKKSPDSSNISWHRLNLKEIQGIVCSHVHQMFLEDPNLIKLVHFQGYDHGLLEITTQGIPSMHCCLDFLPELLNQPDREQQVFGIDLVSHLVVLYTVPKAFSIAQLCVQILSTMAEVLPNSKFITYFPKLVPAMKRIAKAFPPLCKDVSAVLLRIAETCWAVLGNSIPSLEQQTFEFSNLKLSDGRELIDTSLLEVSDENSEMIRLFNECRKAFSFIVSNCLIYKLT